MPWAFLTSLLFDFKALYNSKWYLQYIFCLNWKSQAPHPQSSLELWWNSFEVAVPLSLDQISWLHPVNGVYLMTLWIIWKFWEFSQPFLKAESPFFCSFLLWEARKFQAVFGNLSKETVRLKSATHWSCHLRTAERFSGKFMLILRLGTCYRLLIIGLSFPRDFHYSKWSREGELMGKSEE